jgi:hypothetical protein
MNPHTIECAAEPVGERRSGRHLLSSFEQKNTLTTPGA